MWICDILHQFISQLSWFIYIRLCPLVRLWFKGWCHFMEVFHFFYSKSWKQFGTIYYLERLDVTLTALYFAQYCCKILFSSVEKLTFKKFQKILFRPRTKALNYTHLETLQVRKLFQRDDTAGSIVFCVSNKDWTERGLLWETRGNTWHVVLD